jgi:hypothetical protein
MIFSASVQAVTRVNAEQASKRTMHRQTRLPYRGKLTRLGRSERSSASSPCAGVVATACTYTRKANATREAPRRGRKDDQPEAREGQAGRSGVAERFVVPRKPGNAGGGKGPQFKTDAYVARDLGDWATYKLRNGFKNCRWRRTSSKGVRSCPRAGCGKSACPVR